VWLFVCSTRKVFSNPLFLPNHISFSEHNDKNLHLRTRLFHHCYQYNGFFLSFEVGIYLFSLFILRNLSLFDTTSITSFSINSLLQWGFHIVLVLLWAYCPLRVCCFILIEEINASQCWVMVETHVLSRFKLFWE